MDWQRIGFSVAWFFGALIYQAAVMIVAGGEGAIPTTGRAWIVFAANAVAVAGAKYVTSSKLIGISRQTWTEDERRAAAGQPAKRP